MLNCKCNIIGKLKERRDSRNSENLIVIGVPLMFNSICLVNMHGFYVALWILTGF